MFDVFCVSLIVKCQYRELDSTRGLVVESLASLSVNETDSLC